MDAQTKQAQERDDQMSDNLHVLLDAKGDAKYTALGNQVPCCLASVDTSADQTSAYQNVSAEQRELHSEGSSTCDLSVLCEVCGCS